MTQDRRAKGQEIAKQYFGREITPDKEDDPFFVPALEHLFGEIWSREGLSLRDRSLVTIAALMVLGRDREFGIHLHGALNVGVTPNEIEEMVVHLAYYGGFPTAASGRETVKKVLEMRAGQ
ncbi:MAG: carboxymuconolactone decarboxylase family protein [Pseudomonadota bacterium]